MHLFGNESYLTLEVLVKINRARKEIKIQRQAFAGSFIYTMESQNVTG